VSTPYSEVMAYVHLRIDRGALQAVGMSRAETLVRRTTRRTFNRSQVLCPVDTGYLRASGKFSVGRVARSWRGEIEYTANYAATVHNGRRALTIRARGNKRMRFVVNGEVVFARVVHQPARPARPFLSMALAQVALPAGFRVMNRVYIGDF
jgi:hypothetical protein